VIDYDEKRFRPVGGPTGEEGRVAAYRQSGDLVWGKFTGGRARRGSLTGTAAPDGRLEFGYSMVLDTGEVVSGRCRSTPEILADGRIRLHEVWERYGARAGSGTSCIEEIPSTPTIPRRPR
jgi:hypothetical protein